MKRPPDEQVDPVLLSMVRIEVLAFFQANPYTRDTIEGLARRLHRPLPAVSLAVSSLAALGILVGHQGSGSVTYRLKHGESIAINAGENTVKECFSSNRPVKAHRSQG
ncbi:hypothetical protein [Desulfofundulus sp.]|uniref:hypothetical protein n=1 Tax=Desulfofundulus sp. TaxID=2282750 RepID=UPI003C71F7DF